MKATHLAPELQKLVAEKLATLHKEYPCKGSPNYRARWHQGWVVGVPTHPLTPMEKHHFYTNSGHRAFNNATSYLPMYDLRLDIALQATTNGTHTAIITYAHVRFYPKENQFLVCFPKQGGKHTKLNKYVDNYVMVSIPARIVNRFPKVVTTEEYLETTHGILRYSR